VRKFSLKYFSSLLGIYAIAMIDVIPDEKPISAEKINQKVRDAGAQAVFADRR